MCSVGCPWLAPLSCGVLPASPSTIELSGVDDALPDSLPDAGSLPLDDMPLLDDISKSVLVTEMVNMSRTRCDSIEPVDDSDCTRRTADARTRSSG